MISQFYIYNCRRVRQGQELDVQFTRTLVIVSFIKIENNDLILIYRIKLVKFTGINTDTILELITSYN